MKYPAIKQAILNTALGIAIMGSSCAIAEDFVVVVNVKSSVGNLNAEQVKQLFLGKVATFPTGDQALPVDLASSEIRKDFYLTVTNKTITQLNAYRANMIFSNKGRPPREVPDSSIAKKLVKDNLNVIAYIEKKLVDDSIKVVLAP